MSRSFSDQKIIRILSEQAAGVSVAEVRRKHGVTSSTLFKWRCEFGGIGDSNARKLSALENENGKLKKLMTEVDRLVSKSR